MQSNRFYEILMVVIGIICLTAGLATQSIAKSYPSRPITIIVPHGVGGGGDVGTRIMGRTFQEELGVTFIIKNVTGGGNITGLSAIWKSKPDGYTIGMTYAQTASSSHIFEKVIYDTRKFSIIGRFVRSIFILAVPKNSPFRSVDDLKKAGRPIRVGVSHVTSNSNMVFTALAGEMNFPVASVSGYRGAAGAIVGAMRGECDVLPYGAAIHTYIKEGELIPLLIFDTERSKDFPDVPCLKDLGLPDYLEILGCLDWLFWGPPGIPEDRIAVLEQAMLKAVPQNVPIFNKRGMIPSPLGSKAAKKRLLEIYANMEKYGHTVTRGYKK